MDWDGTLRSGYMMRSWLSFLEQKFSLKNQAVSKFDHLMNSYKNSKLDYHELVEMAGRLYGSSCSGLKHNDLVHESHVFVEGDWDNLFDYTKNILKRIEACHVKPVIISGSPMVPLKSYCHKLGIETVFGIELQTDLTGNCNGKIGLNYGMEENKLRISEKYWSLSNVVFGLGDAVADWPLFAGTENGIFIGKLPFKNNDYPRIREVRRQNISIELGKILSKLNLC